MNLFHVGLNPYGLTYTLGLQGLGTPRANPDGAGIDGFIRIARRIGARTLELDWRWLVSLDTAALRDVAYRADGMTIVVSAWLLHQPDETLDEVRRAARTLGARLIRMHLAPVLEGARASHGARWPEMVTHARRTLTAEAAKGRSEGLSFGIENHQDFGSEELLAFAEQAGSNVGLVLDTGNPFAVGEDPVAFVERAAHRIVHVHLKDYRAQFTNDGYRLIRCAIGDGAVPFAAMAEVLTARAAGPLTASIEPAALEARHIRLFTREWWQGYPLRDARELGVALGRLRTHAFADDDDARTPWEQHAGHEELLAYEADHLARSVEYLHRLGWM